MKVSIINLGCKVNQSECDSIAARFAAMGYEVDRQFSMADIYVINTCAVTAEAEKKSRQCIARVRKYNPAAAVYVIGCASQKNPAQFAGKNITYIGGNADKMAVCCLPQGVSTPPLPTTFESMPMPTGKHARPIVKIQDGCNNFCSYCIVPYLRGRSRSRAIEDIVAECTVKAATCAEIVLTGINVSAYGADSGTTLCALVRALAPIQGVRFRFGSLEAGVINRDLLEAIGEAGNFCDHFHLSLQSGSDSVLAAMNRHYTTEEYAAKVALIRAYFPFAAITTDIIVGFATETEQDFAQTMAFARQIGFADIHIFPYSRRQGTKAYNLALVPAAEVASRVATLTALKNQLHADYIQSFVGHTLELAVETTDGLFACGHSANYIKLYIDDKAQCRPDTLYTVRCVRPYRDGLLVQRA